ncbi:FkbM family methyltransferase [Mariprofundus ferrooxydans]|nr:FkbM family methyltransferase [Mariprofundus ferrooxydans]
MTRHLLHIFFTDARTFEPGNQAYSFLSTSISNNNFTNTTLIAVALSDHKGTGTLHTCSNAELNSLALYYDTNNVDQDVSLKTLDSYLEKYQWSDIDLVKMDTTGGELDVFKGGNAFFTQLSPLVIFAYKNNTTFNTDLIEAFESIGYSIYILIPGLQILAPFNNNDSPDAYLLNLFCCKANTAEKLQQRGLLTQSLPNRSYETSHQNWVDYLQQFPYSSTLIETWDNMPTEHILPGWQTYEHAISLYITAHSKQSSPTVQVQSLHDAFIHLVSLVDIHMTIPRLLSLIRIASELGKRETAIHLLNNVIDNLHETNSFHPDEPFLAVSKYAEKNPVSSTLASWCMAYCMAEKEILSNFSSHSLTDVSSLDLLKTFEGSSYSHEEIQRRFTLIRKRFE